MLDELAPAGKARASQIEAIARQVPDLKQLDADMVTYSGPALTQNLQVFVADELYHAFNLPAPERQTLFTPGRNIIDWQLGVQLVRQAPGGPAPNGTLARKGSLFWKAEEIQRAIGILTQIEYALIIKTLMRADAIVNPGLRTYTPGQYMGEVYLFRVADGRNLGGFRIKAAHSEGGYHVYLNNEVNDMKYSLDTMIWNAVWDGVRRFISGQSAFEPR